MKCLVRRNWDVEKLDRFNEESWETEAHDYAPASALVTLKFKKNWSHSSSILKYHLIAGGGGGSADPTMTSSSSSDAETFFWREKSNVVDQFIIFGKNTIRLSEKSRWPQPVRNSFCTESEHFAKKGKTYFLTLLDRSLLTFGEN